MFFKGVPDGIQHHLHRLPAHPVCPLFSAHLTLSSGRHRHPDPGVRAGLPREPVCGLVGPVSGEETLSDLFVGAQSVTGGCLRAAQRSFFPAILGRRPGLGIRLSGMQAGALPVKCEHVRVHLPHLPDEHRSLAGRYKAFHVTENQNQALPVVSPAGSLGVSIHPVPADAFLPQVSKENIVFPQSTLLIFEFTFQSKKVQVRVGLLNHNNEILGGVLDL